MRANLINSRCGDFILSGWWSDRFGAEKERSYFSFQCARFTEVHCFILYEGVWLRKNSVDVGMSLEHLMQQCNSITRKWKCPNATLCTTNYTWTGPGSKPDCVGENRVVQQVMFTNLGFVGLCILTNSNKSTNYKQQLIAGLLFVV
jgi:hypothetical protein